MLLEIAISPLFAAKVVGIATALGIILPVVQALVSQQNWSPTAKVSLSIAFAVIGGGGAFLIRNGFDFTDLPSLATWIVGIYTAIRVAYQPLNATGIIGKLEAVGSKIEPRDDDLEGEVDGFDNVELPENPYAEGELVPPADPDAPVR